MSKTKSSYYHIDDLPKKKRRFRGTRRFSALAVLILFGAGVYALVLLQAPGLLVNQASAASQSTEEALTNSNQNFIKIDRISLVLPFSASDDASALEKGAWQRNPEQGNPEKGGNFALSAYRFKLALTPSATVEASPFYNLDKLQEKDVINVYYNAKWYSYEVTKIRETSDTEATSSSDSSTLTLISSNSDGSPDGRVVVEASQVGGTKPAPEPTSNTPLL